MIDTDDIIADSEAAQYEHFRCVVDAGQVPVRIDKFLFERMVHSSRNRIQSAADAGYIQVNGKLTRECTVVGLDGGQRHLPLDNVCKVGPFIIL